MKAKRRVPALRGGQPTICLPTPVRGDRISLQRASIGRKIAFKSPGIWGMSVQNNQRPNGTLGEVTNEIDKIKSSTAHEHRSGDQPTDACFCQNREVAL